MPAGFRPGPPRAEVHSVNPTPGWTRRRAAAWTGRAAVLSTLLVAVVVLPSDSYVGVTLPLAIEVLVVPVMITAAWRKPRSSRGVWLLLTASVALAVVGDVIYAVQESVLGEAPFPGLADPFYLASYLPELAAMLLLIQSRHRHTPVEERIDAAIISTPVLAAIAVLLVMPAMDGQAWDAASLLSAAYPVLDTVVLIALIRLAIGGGHRNRSLGLLTASVSVTLLADLLYDGLSTAGLATTAPGWLNALFAMGFLFMAAAVLSSDAVAITHPEAPADDRPIPTGRIVALSTGAIGVPTMALLKIGTGTPASVEILSLAAIAVNLLIGWRAVRLMRTVNTVSIQLAETARTDALTGLPNRRSWDHEVARWDSTSDIDSPATIAILDLDHFKDYNDTYGHLAGDALLTRCAQAWRSALPPHGYLARYGGEEFALILPALADRDPRTTLELIRLATPTDITVSIGHAQRRDGTPLTTVLAAADLALYAAKAQGRDRVVEATPSIPSPRPSCRGELAERTAPLG